MLFLAAKFQNFQDFFSVLSWLRYTVWSSKLKRNYDKKSLFRKNDQHVILSNDEISFIFTSIYFIPKRNANYGWKRNWFFWTMTWDLRGWRLFIRAVNIILKCWSVRKVYCNGRLLFWNHTIFRILNTKLRNSSEQQFKQGNSTTRVS